MEQGPVDLVDCNTYKAVQRSR